MKRPAVSQAKLQARRRSRLLPRAGVNGGKSPSGQGVWHVGLSRVPSKDRVRQPGFAPKSWRDFTGYADCRDTVEFSMSGSRYARLTVKRGRCETPGCPAAGSGAADDRMYPAVGLENRAGTQGFRRVIHSGGCSRWLPGQSRWCSSRGANCSRVVADGPRARDRCRDTCWSGESGPE